MFELFGEYIGLVRRKVVEGFFWCIDYGGGNCQFTWLEYGVAGVVGEEVGVIYVMFESLYFILGIVEWIGLMVENIVLSIE